MTASSRWSEFPNRSDTTDIKNSNGASLIIGPRFTTTNSRKQPRTKALLVLLSLSPPTRYTLHATPTSFFQRKKSTVGFCCWIISRLLAWNSSKHTGFSMAAAPLPIRRHGHPHQHHHHHPPICTMTLWIVAVVLVVVLSVGSNSNSSSKRNSNFMGHPHGRAGGVDAWSMGAPSSSSFAGIALRRLHRRPASSLSSSTTASYSNTRALWTMYHSPSDPPHTNNNQFLSNNHNAWTVLSNTERWIQETLDGANRGVGSSSSSSDSIPNNTQRPATAYARKPVSYVCEPPTGSSSSSSSVLVVANLFRHLKEARERGNLHVTTQRASAAQGKSTPKTRNRYYSGPTPSSNKQTNSQHNSCCILFSYGVRVHRIIIITIVFIIIIMHLFFKPRRNLLAPVVATHTRGDPPLRSRHCQFLCNL